jgi:trigger factor
MEKFTYKKITESADFIEYLVTVDWDLFNSEKDRVFEELAKDVQLPGFRPGKGPRQAIEEKLGTKLLSETLNGLLPRLTYEIIVKEQMNPITQPEYDIKEIDPTKGVVYSFKFTNYPDVKLGDFTKIKVKKKQVNVTEKDVEDVIKNIAQTTLTPDQLKKITKTDLKKTKKATTDTKLKEKKKSSKAGETTQKESVNIELSDDLVKELGYAEHKTLSSLKKEVKTKLEEIQKKQIEEDYISQIVEQALELCEFTIPKILLDRESQNMEREFLSRLEQLKINPDDFLKSQGTSLEEKRKVWKKEAEKRLASDLVLIKIASEYKLLPSDEDVKKEINKITDEKTREQYQNDKAKDYVKTVLTKRRGVEKLKEIVEKQFAKKEEKEKKKKTKA